MNQTIKNACLNYARWDDLPADIKAQFIGFMSGRPERGQALYELYFYWYNIPHEIGHILRRVYQTRNPPDENTWEEETAANQLAVSYWRAKGQMARLHELEMKLKQALLNIPDPVPANEDRVSYLNQYHQKLSDPPSYAHYQFNMVIDALGHPLDFSKALRKLVSDRSNDGATIPLAPNSPIDEDLPYRIIEDMRKTLNAYGLQIPEIQVVCQYAPQIQFVTWEK